MWRPESARHVWETTRGNQTEEEFLPFKEIGLLVECSILLWNNNKYKSHVVRSVF